MRLRHTVLEGSLLFSLACQFANVCSCVSLHLCSCLCICNCAQVCFVVWGAQGCESCQTHLAVRAQAVFKRPVSISCPKNCKENPKLLLEYSLTKTRDVWCLITQRLREVCLGTALVLA